MTKLADRRQARLRAAAKISLLRSGVVTLFIMHPLEFSESVNVLTS
jgi:hypothetical protein